MDKFVEFVCNQAKLIGYLFVLDSGEGREVYIESLKLYGENLSGWLIPIEFKNEVIELRRSSGSMKKYEAFYCFAVWEKDTEGNISVSFTMASELN